MNRLRYLLAMVMFGVLASSPAFDVTAKSAIAIDGASGKILWSKDANAAMFPASTTKIMTGLLLIERCKPTDIIVAPPDIETVKGSSMHLKPGEQVTAHDMLYALMLRSANDGCYAVAVHISGSVAAFSKLMNERAKAVGCTHTHFHNPNGLNDPEHTTTAHDLALIARAAMRYPAFREVVKTYKYEINRSMNLHDRVMVNHDKLLKWDPLAEGIKTGWTNPAGHCFVGSSTRNGFRVIAVVMKSQHWQKDDEMLMDWSFHHFEKKELLPAGKVVGELPVTGGETKTLPVALASEAYTLGLVGAASKKASVQVAAAPKLAAPIKKGDRVGDVELRDEDGWVQKLPVLATQDVASVKIGSIMPAKGSPGSTLMFGGALFVGAYLVRGRARKKIKYYGRQTKAKGR